MQRTDSGGSLQQRPSSFTPSDRPESNRRDRPAGSLPCLCRVPSGRFPASSRVSAPRFLPNRRTASVTKPADGKRRVSRAEQTTPWAATGEVPTVSVRSIQYRISWNLSNAPAISKLRPVEPAVKSRAGSPLAPNRTSSKPSLSVYWQSTHHPQITHTLPAHHPQRVVSRRVDPPRAQPGRAALPPPASGNRSEAVAPTP